MLPQWTRVDLGAMTMRGTSHSPKFQHFWSLTIVIFRTIVSGRLTPLQRSSRYTLQPQPIWPTSRVNKRRYFLSTRAWASIKFGQNVSGVIISVRYDNSFKDLLFVTLTVKVTLQLHEINQVVVGAAISDLFSFDLLIHTASQNLKLWAVC